MPWYVYKAVSADGEVLEGELEAPDRSSVVERLRSQGHVPIRAEERKGGGDGVAWRRVARRSGGVGAGDQRWELAHPSPPDVRRPGAPRAPLAAPIRRDVLAPAVSAADAPGARVVAPLPGTGGGAPHGPVPP